MTVPKKDLAVTHDSATGTARHHKAPHESAIRVRMYRVGFGDCFLVSFPDGGGSKHVLVDCGVHPRGNIGTIQKVVENVAAETERKLSLVIATHAHQDHLSGFASQESMFRGFEVGEVWLPWTENPKDPVAVKLNARQAALTAMLAEHLAVKPPAGAETAVHAAVENLSGNGEALRLLRSGINGGAVRYLEAGIKKKDVAGIAGLSARILGPPRDPKFLAKMDPPADERFLRATPAGGVEAVNAIEPFDPNWKVNADSNPYYAALDNRDKNLLAVAATDAQGLAFALDNVRNNTSIVALFTYGGRNLLFPGDAQYGNWESWIDKTGADSLLSAVDFYKVAHHGSFNATPKTALDRMTDQGFSAMVSTQSVPWASIPMPKLMTALSGKARLALRSDSIKVKGAPEGPPVAKLPKECTAGELWYDCFLPVSATHA